MTRLYDLGLASKKMAADLFCSRLQACGRRAEVERLNRLANEFASRNLAGRGAFPKITVRPYLSHRISAWEVQNSGRREFYNIYPVIWVPLSLISAQVVIGQ